MYKEGVLNAIVGKDQFTYKGSPTKVSPDF